MGWSARTNHSANSTKTGCFYCPGGVEAESYPHKAMRQSLHVNKISKDISADGTVVVF